MLIAAAIAGVLVIATVLLDAFETIVLPRRVQRSFRLTAFFYRSTWIPWMKLGRRIPSLTRRESFLGYFGPLSLIVLLVCWAGGLIFGFALDRKSTRLNSSHQIISYAVFCLKKKNKKD